MSSSLWGKCQESFAVLPVQSESQIVPLCSGNRGLGMSWAAESQRDQRGMVALLPPGRVKVMLATQLR